jgi:hypothetical protein
MLLLTVYPTPEAVIILIARCVKLAVVVVRVAVWKNRFPVMVHAELFEATRIPLDAVEALK